MWQTMHVPIPILIFYFFYFLKANSKHILAKETENKMAVMIMHIALQSGCNYILYTVPVGTSSKGADKGPEKGNQNDQVVRV